MNLALSSSHHLKTTAESSSPNKRDLMKKHFIAHDATESRLNPQDAEFARSLLAKVRSTAACANCAQTKTKCDNDVKQPCTRCRSKGLTCAARPTRPRGPKPRQARPAQNKPLVGTATESADNGRTENDGAESPAASCTVDKQALSGADAEGEPGPSIHVASSSLAPPASPWNISSDLSCLAPYDVDSHRGVLRTENPDVYMTSGEGGGTDGLCQQQTSPSTANGQADAQSESNMRQSVSIDQTVAFSQDLFQPMGATNDGPAMYGPSWDLGSTPDQFFNPASEVFGPFLGFPSPGYFNTDAPIVTHPSEDIIMREAEQLRNSEDLYPGLQSQRQSELRLETGHSIDSSQGKKNGKAMVTQTPRADTTSPLALDNDLDASSTNDSTDPWFLPKDVEHWTMLQCCPKPSTVAPGRAIANLAFLEENSRRSPGPWSVRSPGSSEKSGQSAPGRLPRVNISLSSVTRERISAITQSFFPKALETHGLGVTSSPSSYRRASEWFGSSGYILLPPTEDLEVFLENYMNYVEPYFPLVPTRTLDPNELLIASGNEKGATLLLLLMIAIGATCDPATKARRLGAGLAEMCRISLTDLVEKDNQYSTVPLILQCSLLLTIQSCWGGDKWQMDIGAGHRSIYISVSYLLVSQSTHDGMRLQSLDARELGLLQRDDPEASQVRHRWAWSTHRVENVG